MDLIILENIEGELRVDSRLIAEKLGNDHKNVVEMIRRYNPRLEKYGRVAFKTEPLKTNGGIQSTAVYYLNEKQSTFLVTLSRNSEKAVELKQQLTDSYFHYRERQKPKELSRIEILEIALKSEKENLKLKSELQQAQPKIEFHDKLIKSDGLYSMGEAAKILGTGRTRFFEQLREDEIFFGREPYQSFIGRGYFELKTTTKNDHVQKQTFLTPKGLSWIKKKFYSEAYQTNF